MKIIYTRPDGGVSVVTPAAQSDVAKFLPEVTDMTPMEFVEFIKLRDVPEGSLNVQIVPDSAIPSDRAARNRWRITA